MQEDKEYATVLKRKLEGLRTAIEADRVKVQELFQQIAEKEQQADYIIELLKAEGEHLGEEELRGLSSESVSDMAYKVLVSSSDKKPMYYRELADKIMSEGQVIPGQDPAANLISHLNRDDRFVRTGRGIYGLAEWGLQPSRPRKRTKKKRS